MLSNAHSQVRRPAPERSLATFLKYKTKQCKFTMYIVLVVSFINCLLVLLTKKEITRILKYQ